MPKYMIIHNAPVPTVEFMSNSSPDQIQKSMDEWMAWKNEAENTVKFEWGMPMQAISRVTPYGAEKSDSSASGYSMIEAGSKDDVINVLMNHPHLKRPDATMDIFELITMPGM